MHSMPEQSSAASRMSAGDKPSSLCVNLASATAAAPEMSRNPKILAIILNIGGPDIATTTGSGARGTEPSRRLIRVPVSGFDHRRLVVARCC
jgi:hypothetical protein